MRHGLRTLAVLSALCLALGAGCRQSAPSTLPVAFTPCPVKGPGPVDSSWRRVRASGFTFCVPGSWRPSGPASDSLDAKAWRGDEGSLTWDLGRPESTTPRTKTAEVEAPVVAGRGRNLPRAMPAAPTMPMVGTAPCSAPTRTNTPFMVDSVVVVATQTACGGTWMMTGWSTTPAIYVQGETHSPEEAKVLNAIVLTIRFASPKP
jgi:hypothetical protein